jgi:Amt family ammonium transporter
MNFKRKLSGLAPALAAALFIGFAPAAAMAQATAPATTDAPAAAAPAAPAAPSAATPAPSAKPPPPAVPACAGAVAAVPETDKYAAVAAVPAVLTNCTPSGGDTAWMLTSVALVLMMTIPGLGLFYGGMVRKKNVGDTVMTSFAITCLVTVVYAIVTYSMAFTSGTPFVGGLSRAFLQGILSDINNGGIGNPNPLAPTIPETVYMCFQMTFAIITPALIAGAYAERMKFSAMLWFMGLWAIFVYAPVAHWLWGPDGIFNSSNDAAWVKVLDFAGGTVVHINAGVAGLVAALMLGKRQATTWS